MAGPKRGGVSSASSYAASHLSLSVLALLSSSGFSRSSSAAAHLLTEVLQRYIQLIGTTCVQHANHGGRTIVAPRDLSAALEHIMGGDPVEEVLQWAEDEGRLDFDAEEEIEAEQHAHAAHAANGIHAGQQQPSQPPRTTKSTSAAEATAATSEARDPLRDPDRAKDLRRWLSVGRPRPPMDPAADAHYVAVAPELFDTLAEESYRSERRIERLLWSGCASDRGDRGSPVREGKMKAVDPDAMDIDTGAGVGSNQDTFRRPRSRSGSTTASELDSELSSDTESSHSRRGRIRRSRSVEYRSLANEAGQFGSNGTTAPRPPSSPPTMGRNQLSSPSNQRRSPSAGSLAADFDDDDHLRCFGSLEVDYVPSYLPAFPSYESSGPQREAEQTKRSDANGHRLSPAPSSIKAEEAAHIGDRGADETAAPAKEEPVLQPKFAPQDTDLEHVEQERQRIEAAQRVALAATVAEAAAGAAEGVETVEAAAGTKEPTAEERAAEAEKAFEAMQARRILRDCWREAIPFETSTLGATCSAKELGDLEKFVSDASSAREDLISIAPPTSSLRAFAADFRALVEDPSTSGAAGIPLTPAGAAQQDAASKRRRLAYGIADPARYAPNDSLYGAVGARPVMVPFQPGPSWLVSTLPPPTLYEDNDQVAAALSAPILTPTNPQGRPAALVPPSGSLVPSLAYRHPTHLSIAARIVSNSELLKRVSRYDDPAPLLDDKHAERFFHGLPASRDLVGGSSSSSDLSSNISKSRNGGGGSGSGNTTLRAALEKLVLQLKAKEAVVLPEEDKEELQRRQQELQLQLQAAESAADGSGGGGGGGKGDATGAASGLIGDSYASRIRNGNITMVHTWDWTTRDAYDGSLPGKRVRGSDAGLGSAATAPLALERERDKRRRESSAANGAPPAGSSMALDWTGENGSA